ncbi:OVARIAN TUMOR DOMAIN-containing deubiquitinating enzyme 6-like [Bidens hawaiensis]|uniref:OVARIAN TUMOR DOMAIN-containing deubiquitinating enzyme 6-like n=1 Tax=Bidens hawaiensis TaxID=980011 RepID=UPI004049E31F
MTRVRVVLQRASASADSSSSRTPEAQEHHPCEYEDVTLDVVEDKSEELSAVGQEEDNLARMAALRVIDEEEEEENDVSKDDNYALQDIHGGSSCPPAPPAPPPKPRIGSSRRVNVWPVVSTRTSPTGSHPSSPKSHGDNEGYNSADEQIPCYGSSYDNAERDRQFEIDIRRLKGFEVKNMNEDGNCLFRAVADQVYGDSEAYDLARQMCIDYMERERDHFSQFITEGFTSYCKRKRRDKVYGNNVEIQALSEMYNRPIHIYSYSSEPINIFHGSYNTDTPPIRLSYHHGNHYNSLVDPRRLTVGAGLGFSSLQGSDVDKNQVKAAIKAQQDQQIDNALLAEARFYSDVELTEKELECMVMEASRAEYVAANERFIHQLGATESSSSSSGPSSSATSTDSRKEQDKGLIISSSMQMVLSMGFSYVQAIEAYSIFGDDVDSMVCYLLEINTRRKGKAATTTAPTEKRSNK